MKDLIEAMLTAVAEHRHNHSQLSAKYEEMAADATDRNEKGSLSQLKKLHEQRAQVYEDLLNELEHIVCSEMGDNWRETMPS